MTTFTEGLHPGEHLVHEPHITLCREVVTVGTGADLTVATVLGQITASGKYVQLNPTETDGSQVAAGVLFDDAAAASADVTDAVITKRLTSVKAAVLVWPAGITDPQKAQAITELKALNIIPV